MLRVAMREIDITPAPASHRCAVYDTSGPYSDPARHRHRAGLPALRAAWIAAHGDVERYEAAPCS